jgi:hypothetical protein
LGLVVLALAGCAGQPVVADAPAPAGLAPAHYSGPLRSPMTYAGLGIALRPPAVLTPPMNWEQAYVAACGHGEALCQPDQSPTIALADATLTNSSVRVANPVYVMTYTNVPCVPTGPVPPSWSTVPPVTPSLCLEISLIDATTGRFAYGASGTTP